MDGVMDGVFAAVELIGAAAQMAEMSNAGSEEYDRYENKRKKRNERRKKELLLSQTKKIKPEPKRIVPNTNGTKHFLSPVSNPSQFNQQPIQQISNVSKTSTPQNNNEEQLPSAPPVYDLNENEQSSLYEGMQSSTNFKESNENLKEENLKNIPPEEKDYFLHYIIETDTWPRLSLKYSVHKEDILRLNKLVDDDLDLIRMEKPALLIPKPNVHLESVIQSINYDDLDNAFKIRKFCTNAKCSREESYFYLSEQKFDYEKAWNQYLDDKNWEETQLGKNKIENALKKSQS